MDSIVINLGDFLKNAGIVGLNYILEDVICAEKDKDYGYTPDRQAIWIARDFALSCDWTDIYFKAFTKYYRDYSVYQAVIDEINGILAVVENDNFKLKDVKEKLKFINDKLLSNSYKSGFVSVKDQLDVIQPYEELQAQKLKDTMDVKEVKRRLEELLRFLKQPVCEETFVMKSALYNYINRFWDGKCFLLRANAAKNMREVFEADFAVPLREYIKKSHDKEKDICIDCGNLISGKEKVSIAFMKDMADDLSRKRSAFWNCKVDAFLCPVCAYIYALAPLGFLIIGRRYVFVNISSDIDNLLAANNKYGHESIESQKDTEKEERYSSWIARTINILLGIKTKGLSNVQVITRGMNDTDTYTFDVISKHVLSILNDKWIKNSIDSLSKHPYVKNGPDYINVHESVILNILRYRSQYDLLNTLLKIAIETNGVVYTAAKVFDAQLSTNIHNVDSEKRKGTMIVKQKDVTNQGYILRKNLLAAKGTTDDSCLRGTIYQLLNALSVGNVNRFMEIVIRAYCSTTLHAPKEFVECLGDKDKLKESGYAFLLGLQGTYCEKKEEFTNE